MPYCGIFSKIAVNTAKTGGIIMNENTQNEAVKKPLYKKWWFWAIIVFVVIVALSTGGGKETDTGETAATGEESKQATSKDDVQLGSGTIGDYDVEIKDCTLSTDYEGNPVAIVTYSWTNNDDKAQSFMVAITDKAYQNDIECQRAYMSDDSNFNRDSETADIKPGATYEVQKAYELLDETTPLIVETAECFGFDDAIIRQTFEIAQ